MTFIRFASAVSTSYGWLISLAVLTGLTALCAILVFVLDTRQAPDGFAIVRQTTGMADPLRLSMLRRASVTALLYNDLVVSRVTKAMLVGVGLAAVATTGLIAWMLTNGGAA